MHARENQREVDGCSCGLCFISQAVKIIDDSHFIEKVVRFPSDYYSRQHDLYVLFFRLFGVFDISGVPQWPDLVITLQWITTNPQ